MNPLVDRSEFEALYDRHESSVFNFCLRAVGSGPAAAAATKAAFLEACRKRDAEVVHLFAAARSEIAGLVAAPRDHRATASAPLAVSEANGRLAVGHREVLALRELIGCSYDEIAGVIGAERETVAALLWQARLELRDKLEGSRLVSIAPLAPVCERALGLMAMSCDGELCDRDEWSWLQRHLRTCGKCRLSKEAARQASAYYRDWAPAAAPRGLRESSLAAAERFLAGDSRAAGSRIRNVEPTPS